MKSTSCLWCQSLMRACAVVSAALVVALSVAACAVAPGEQAQAQPRTLVQSDAAAPRNIIILFADGVAPTQWEYGRYTSALLRQQPFVTTDVVLKQGVLGLASTYPFGAFVTDSAAAGSAMSTGSKVANGSISMSPHGKPLTTAMQLAKASGKRIGLVTTATIYDATPAAFSAHAKSRADSQTIVDEYLALEPDVLLGGGADYFLPANAAGGKRNEGCDVIAAFRTKGWQ